MTDGRLFLGIVTLISIGVFLNGRRFARMTENPWAGRQIMGLPIKGSEPPVERVRFVGRINMIFAPIFWLLCVALCFGLLGSIKGISPIHPPRSVRS
jgi:hypothetical protein